MEDIENEVKSVENHIPKGEMVTGVIYLCVARNFTRGMWNGEVFEYIRTKWGNEFPDTEYHYDDGAPYGTVRPIKIIKD